MREKTAEKDVSEGFKDLDIIRSTGVGDVQLIQWTHQSSRSPSHNCKFFGVRMKIDGITGDFYDGTQHLLLEFGRDRFGAENAYKALALAEAQAILMPDEDFDG